jgi:UDP:flavonoid glycosyltransferase YjiC (YdhE family)
MARFLFTMLPANDLGLPTRLVPIARLLADRGHEVAVFNPAPAPAKLIQDAGLKNLPMPPRTLPEYSMDLAAVSEAWDVEHMYAAIFSDEDYVRAVTALHVELMRDFAPDAVVDSFGLPACLAARARKIPLASVLQGNFHPASDGFLWWKGVRPNGLPSAALVVNKVAAEYGLAPHTRCVDWLGGDLSLIVGTPETDPVSDSAAVAHVGPIEWQRGDAVLPDWVGELSRDRPVVWVYSGNPRYANAPTPIDSVVVIRAAIAALADAPVQVVLTTGYQDLPAEFGTLPKNFRHAAYLPGRAMAERCDLMVHHGGHGSVMTGLAAGTPMVIVPTITERESNARRVAALGAGEIVLPVSGADGEKRIDADEFGAAVWQVLREPSYRASAARIAESMRNFGGAREAADRIEPLARAVN